MSDQPGATAYSPLSKAALFNADMAAQPKGRTMTYPTLTQAIGALVLAASGIAGPAIAQSMDEPVKITVSYGDLDIGHPAGAEVLFRRLDAAATKACGGAPDIRVLADVAAFDKCRSSALDRAVAEIHSPALTAVATESGATVRLAHR